ncbi:rubredoxin [Cytophaga aurantiaca]|uniref:rubredoxin n=1 Tax=Cytophaga aurantiaca TaxID=29530 RepID=UPI0003713D23|nr:rubredoxin [Cytophaga aurantiaca]
MPKQVSIQVYCNGGFVSPGELRKIAMLAQQFGANCLQLGIRQEIRFSIDKDQVEQFKVRMKLLSLQYSISVHESYNIICSALVKDILKTKVWLTEGDYRDILDSFDFQPRIAINIVDPDQHAIPLFTGVLNFVASSTENYWNVYFSLPQQKEQGWMPILIQSDKIANFSMFIQTCIQAQDKISLSELMEELYQLDTWNFKKVDSYPAIPDYHFFPVEGFHTNGNAQWLGIFNKSNEFSIALIDAICVEALESNIGTIYITPWDSFLLKNIAPTRILFWENLLGLYNVNTGHAAHELNWNMNEWNENSNEVRTYVNDYFRVKDERTEGLIIGVNNEANDNFYSIKIVEEPLFSLFGRNYFSVYHIRYKENFNPNNPVDKSFMDYVKKKNLPEFICYLTREFYRKKNAQSEKVEVKQKATPSVIKRKESFEFVYQCTSCLTLYDPEFGDPDEGIVAGTSYDELPENYCCSICSNPKKGFKLFLGFDKEHA